MSIYDIINHSPDWFSICYLILIFGYICIEAGYAEGKNQDVDNDRTSFINPYMRIVMPVISVIYLLIKISF